MKIGEVIVESIRFNAPHPNTAMVDYHAKTTLGFLKGEMMVYLKDFQNDAQIAQYIKETIHKDFA